MSKSKRGPASAPAQPFRDLTLSLRVDGFRDDCLGCSGIADRLVETAPTGDLSEMAELVKDIDFHINKDRHGGRVS